jgi:hypothetical protein
VVKVYAEYLGETRGRGVHHGAAVAKGLQQQMYGIEPAASKESSINQ